MTTQLLLDDLEREGLVHEHPDGEAGLGRYELTQAGEATIALGEDAAALSASD